MTGSQRMTISRLPSTGPRRGAPAAEGHRAVDGLPVLRAATQEDDDFGFDVFVQSRLPGEDFAGFEPAFRTIILKQQYAGQIAGFRQDYAGAAVQIVSLGDDDVGRLITDRGGSAWTLLDIAIMPRWRGRGLGSILIRSLMAEADSAGRPLDLMVATRNTRALRLYLGLGFVISQATAPHLTMRYDGSGGDGA